MGTGGPGGNSREMGLLHPASCGPVTSQLVFFSRQAQNRDFRNFLYLKGWQQIPIFKSQSVGKRTQVLLWTRSQVLGPFPPSEQQRPRAVST